MLHKQKHDSRLKRVMQRVSTENHGFAERRRVGARAEQQTTGLRGKTHFHTCTQNSRS